MKKSFCVIVFIILFLFCFCSCTDVSLTAEKERKEKLVTVKFFNGSKYFETQVEKDSTFSLELSDLALENHSELFLGWNVGKQFFPKTDEEILSVKIEEDTTIEPVFDINFTQQSPTDLDFFTSRLNTAKYEEFSSYSSSGFIYPALSKNENYVIQGSTYVEKYNLVLLTAYAPKYSSGIFNNSVIFVIDLNKIDANGFKGRLTKTIVLHDLDDNDFLGHVGGIASTEENIYITGKNSLYRLPLETVLIPSKLIFAKFEEKIIMPVSASYCFYDNGVLWTGEFALEKENYKTDDSHKSVHNGIDYTAWTVGYEIDETKGNPHIFKMSSSKSEPYAIPDYVLIHGDKIQGFAYVDSKVVLSESYGRKNDSYWQVYDISEAINQTNCADFTTVDIDGNEIKALYLTNPRTVTVPPMSEDLCLIKENGKRYLLFVSEGACNKYLSDPFLGNSKNPSSITWKIDVEMLFGK